MGGVFWNIQPDCDPMLNLRFITNCTGYFSKTVAELIKGQGWTINCLRDKTPDGYNLVSDGILGTPQECGIVFQNGSAGFEHIAGVICKKFEDDLELPGVCEWMLGLDCGCRASDLSGVSILLAMDGKLTSYLLLEYPEDAILLSVRLNLHKKLKEVTRYISTLRREEIYRANA